MRLPSPLLSLVAALFCQAALGSADQSSRHWEQPSVTLHVAPGGGQPLKELQAAVGAAASSWNAVGAGPELIVDGAVTRAQAPELDGVNAVFFVHGEWPWDPSEIALTFKHVHASTGEIIEVDIALNAVHHRFGDRHDAFDVENVVAHELGHALGLPHLDDEPEATMYPSIQHAELKKRDLEHSDEGALLSLYEGIALDAPGHGCAATGPADASSLLALGGLLLLGRRSLRRRSAKRS